MSSENGSANTRESIRQKLLSSSNAKPKSKVISLFGVDVEVRQPTLRAMMEFKAIEENDVRVTTVIIRYCYVPGTQELVFEESDADMILEWPFGEDITRLNAAVAELTGVDIQQPTIGIDASKQVKEVKDDPLSDSPSNSPSA
jgi:hypothetical protein